jgi:hypothetical protein
MKILKMVSIMSVFLILFNVSAAFAGMEEAYNSVQNNQFAPAMGMNNSQLPINFSTYKNAQDASAALLKKFDTGGGHINYQGLSKALWDGKFNGAKFSKQELISVLVEDLKGLKR